VKKTKNNKRSKQYCGGWC